MTNSKQSNKRAVTRFTALFICMILICGITLPLFAFADKGIRISRSNRCTIHTYIDSSNAQVLYMASGTSATWSNYDYNTLYYTTNYYYDNTIGYYYYCNVYLNGQFNSNLLSTDPNNPTLIHDNDILYYNSNGQQSSIKKFYFKIVPSGYTLTFNSQGGSSISPLTGVSGIVHLGESGQYYPQYVPTKHGYDFIGWSLTENGTVVWDVDVQADTTLYARWQIQGTYREITFGDGFYENPECTDDIAGALVLYNSEMVVYAKRDDFTPYEFNQLDKWKHFYGNITLTQTDGNHSIRNMQGHAIRDTQYKWADNVFEFHIIVDKNYHVECNFANTYNYTVKIIYNDYESLKPYIQFYYWQGMQYALNPWWQTSNENTYLTDDVLGINDIIAISLPYVMFSAKITVPDNLSYVNTDVIINSKVVEDNSEYHASNRVYFTANPYYDYEDLEQNIFPLLTINCKSITDYDITQDYHPLIVYDESTGEASWGFEEVSLLDTNWNTVADNVPYKMNHIWDGIFSLSGLAVLIPLVMMVSFAMWFIRRS